MNGYGTPNLCAKRPQAKALGRIFGATSPPRPPHSRLWGHYLDATYLIFKLGFGNLRPRPRLKVLTSRPSNAKVSFLGVDLNYYPVITT